MADFGFDAFPTQIPGGRHSSWPPWLDCPLWKERTSSRVNRRNVLYDLRLDVQRLSPFFSSLIAFGGWVVGATPASASHCDTQTRWSRCSLRKASYLLAVKRTAWVCVKDAGITTPLSTIQELAAVQAAKVGDRSCSHYPEDISAASDNCFRLQVAFPKPASISQSRPAG